MLIFLVTILCWISRKYIITPFIPHFDDSMIAITSAIFLFIIPSKNKKHLLEWNEAVKIPWGILFYLVGAFYRKWISDNSNGSMDWEST